MASGTISANADYIIATGQSTAGGETWDWEKYKSGLVKARAVITHTGLNYSSTWGASYYSVCPSKALPSGLFATSNGMKMNAAIIGVASGGDCILGSPSASSTNPSLTTDHVPNLVVYRFASATSGRTATISYEVVGRWTA